VTVSILLIDQDTETVEDIEPLLAREGFRVEQTLPSRAAIRQVLVDEPDLVILGLQGEEEEWRFCRQLLTFLDSPLLLLLSSGDRLDHVKGLELGADDCMAKPLLLVEFMARVRALVRRHSPAGSRRQRGYFVDGDLVVDLTRREAWLNGEPLALTRTEFRLLTCFVQHAGETLSHDRLLAQVWGPAHTASAATLKPHICHLRQKLEPDRARPQRLVTRWGEGYLFQRLAADGESGQEGDNTAARKYEPGIAKL
jgi:DNA-binding response OmpR family regulator